MSLTVFYIMAEIFGEAEEIFFDADEGIEGEVADDGELTEEEKEELEEEAKEASENIDKLKNVVSKLKELDVPQMLRKFTKFIVQQAAIGAIFYGISILLKKLTASGGAGNTDANKKKLAKTKALSTLLKDLTDTSDAIAKWLKENENVRVKMDGIPMPLVDLFIQYTDIISKVSFKI